MIERPQSAAEILGLETATQIRLLNVQLERQRHLLELLLRNTGVAGECDGCHAGVLWVVHASGARTPYNLDGLNHLVTCEKAVHTTGAIE